MMKKRQFMDKALCLELWKGHLDLHIQCPTIQAAMHKTLTMA